MHKLSNLTVKKVMKPGRHGDGGGLYLQVTPNLTKSWIFRHKQREMGLGPYPTISLAAAREKAAECRKQVAAGLDPLEARRAASKPVRSITFDQAAAEYIKAHEKGWRHPKTAKQHRARLALYASPVIGRLDVKAIDRNDILAVLSPIWFEKNTTASRLRGYLESVFDFCAAKDYRDGNQRNPATWRGGLSSLLTERKRVHKVTHYQAMRYQDVPEFMAGLRASTKLEARALEILILTACRTSEVLKATRAEFKSDVWHIPGSRMKSGQPHSVPLGARCVEIIEDLPERPNNPHIFPSRKPGVPITSMPLRAFMKQAAAGHTIHGFRSSFRQWAAECTDTPREVVEMSLAHTVGSATGRSYQRSDLLSKRRDLLLQWERFCGSEKA